MVKDDGARVIPDSPWEVADLVREFDYRTQVWGVGNEEAAGIIRAYRDREVAEALQLLRAELEEINEARLCCYDEHRALVNAVRNALDSVNRHQMRDVLVDALAEHGQSGEGWANTVDALRARVAEQAGDIERLTLGLRRIVSDAEQCAAWAKDEQRGRQVAQFETLVGIARAALGAASGQTKEATGV